LKDKEEEEEEEEEISAGEAFKLYTLFPFFFVTYDILL
jgi:hypothetical protein